ncbi:hypothetical protein RhiirA5_417874 [Rhizophagus irregularis]|uniref:Uncharacterized protein n=1 Tax=Rhizophagus irregularis TaxID=588596 RepID=A0A2N0PLK1_9GLOM|nr:hypothetical protein RhiirA5_417874 [Rhizophagus irregularis]
MSVSSIKIISLFNSVKLIDMDTFQLLIARNAPASKYFIQLLFKCFLKHNQYYFDVDRNNCAFQKVILLRTSNLPMLVYKLIEGLANANEDLSSKGNNLELFHFLSVNLHVINQVPRMLTKIENSIYNPVKSPPRSKSLQLIPIPKYLSFKGDYKKQLRQGNSLRIMSSNRPLKFLTHFTNNVETYGSRKIKQRRRNRYVRQRNTSIYNLRLINLPQQSVNDPFINMFFNGIPF